MLTDNGAGSPPPVAKTLSYKFFFHVVLIIIAISICYSNTLHQEWHFDDNPNIVNSKEIHLKDISLNGIINSFYSHDLNKKRLYRPAARLSLALNYYFSGLNTFSYHVTNICIHILAAIFAYLVFLKTLLIMRDKGYAAFHHVSCNDIALLGAVFWAIHPIQTQAVTYIVQRMTSMSAMFYMMSMFFYILLRQRRGLINRSIYLCLVLSCGILAVLSKENAVMLPLGIILFELVFFDARIKKSKFIFYGILAFLTLAILSFAAFRGIHIVEKILGLYEQRVFTMGQRLLTEPRIIVQYLFLIFCPLADFLSYESDIVHSTGLFSPVSTFFSIIFLGLLLGFAITYLKRFKLLCFAILFYFINHLVESTFIGLELYFVHRNYLPSMFLYLSLAYYLIKGMNFYKIQNKKIMQGFVITLITALVISEGNAAYLRNDIWQTEESLLTNTIKKVPGNIRPRLSLAAGYIGKKEYDKAIEILKKAEKIYRTDEKLVQKNWIGLIYYNTGIVHSKKEHNEKALRYFIESLKYAHSDWQTHVNLGYLYFKENDIENSLISYFNAWQLKNDEPMLINMYGRALYENKQIAEALGAFKDALKINDSKKIDASELIKVMKIIRPDKYTGLKKFQVKIGFSYNRDVKIGEITSLLDDKFVETLMEFKKLEHKIDTESGILYIKLIKK